MGGDKGGQQVSPHSAHSAAIWPRSTCGGSANFPVIVNTLKLTKHTHYFLLLPGLEEPEVQEAMTADYRGPSALELSPEAGSRGAEEDLPLDRASESS